MPRKCTVCSHKNLSDIDSILVQGSESYRTIADRFGLSQTALKRHKVEHLPVKLVAAAVERKLEEGADLLDELGELKYRAERILETAERAGTLQVALNGIREVRGVLELIAKMVVYEKSTFQQGGILEIVHSPCGKEECPYYNAEDQSYEIPAAEQKQGRCSTK